MTRSLCQEVTKNWHSIPSNRTTACSGSNVSVDLGIVSLTLGNFGFPFRNRLSRYPQFFCYRFLRKSLLSPQLPQFFSQQTPSRLSVLVKSIFIKTFIWIFVKDPAVSFTQPFVAFGCTFRICCFKVFFCHTPFIRTETSL